MIGGGSGTDSPLVWALAALATPTSATRKIRANIMSFRLRDRPITRLVPLLTQPGPVFELPPRATPSYPPAPTPGPIDQQKTQSYRNGLIDQQRQLDRSGVSPGSQRSREIQQQLNQPGSQ